MPQYSFARGMWNPEELPMTYSPICKDYVSVEQEDDCIVSGINPKLNDYNYIGLAMRDPVMGDHVIKTECSFESYGAPLIVLADGVHTDANGIRHYDAFYEVVAYEGGCNVWRILPVPDPKRPERNFTVISITRETFTIEGNSRIHMTIRTIGKRLAVTVNDYSFEVDVPELPDSYYVGATLCEGVNRFYSLSVE